MSNSLFESVYPESKFGGFSRYDGTVAFYSRVQSLLRPNSVVIDLGCGRGAAHQEDSCDYRRSLRDLSGSGRTVIGVDVDSSAAENPSLDEFRLMEDVNHWPLESDSVDFIVTDFVLEHVEDPGGFFAEAHRIMRPGAVFCARTPNANGYVALMSRMIPNRLHSRVTTSVQSHREEFDVFPTWYRCNSRASLRRRLDQHDFTHSIYRIEPEPGYMAFSSIAFRMAAVFHTITPPPFQSTLLVFARKPVCDAVENLKAA